jgi:hypothetical protein
LAADYQLIATVPGQMETVLRIEDQAHIPNDGGNRDWNEYQTWLSEGNTPDPAPAPPDPPPAPLELDAHPTDDMHAVTKLYQDTELAKLSARIDVMERWAAPYRR